MKYVSALVLVGLLSINTVYAGGKAGNGGVMFHCADRIKLVDFWEAEDRGFPMDLGDDNADLQSLIQEYDSRLRYFDPELADDYLNTAQIILRDLELLEKNPRSQETKLVRFTDGTLPESLDSDEITQPFGCEKIQVVTQKKPDTDGEKLLTIDRFLWEMLDNEMRVFTIYHEINVKRQIERLRINHYFTSLQRHPAYIPPLTSTRNARLFNAWIGSSDLTSTKTIADYAANAFAWGVQHELIYFNSGATKANTPLALYCSMYNPIFVFTNSRNIIESAYCTLKTPKHISNTGVRLTNTYTEMRFQMTCSEQDECISGTFRQRVDRYDQFTDSNSNQLVAWERSLGGKSKKIYLEAVPETSFSIYSDMRIVFQNVVRKRELSMMSMRRTEKKMGYADIEFSPEGRASLLSVRSKTGKKK